MALYKPSGSGQTEFEILKASHKFLRDDDKHEADLPWEERLAQKYYKSLYREFAVCDLKHYKSGNFALRWRTEEEVISGAGQTTCGNTRCSLHPPRNVDPEDPRHSLKTLELPFSYVEDSQNKFALVKVVLCDKCSKKLMYKRNKEKGREKEKDRAAQPESRGESAGAGGSVNVPEDANGEDARNNSRAQTKAEFSEHPGERHSSRKALVEDGSERRRSRKHGQGGPERGHDERRHHRSSRSRSPRGRERILRRNRSHSK